MMESDKHMENILETVQHDYQHLSNEVAGLKSDYEHLRDAVTRGFEDQGRIMSRLSEKLERTGKIDFTNIWAGLSFFAFIIVAIGTLGAYGINNKIDNFVEDLKAHTSQPAHIHAMGQLGRDGEKLNAVINDVDEFDDKISNLDTVLQREMRLLDASGDEKVNGLDARLQQEMKLIQKGNDIEIAELKRRLGRIENNKGERHP